MPTLFDTPSLYNGLIWIFCYLLILQLAIFWKNILDTSVTDQEKYTQKFYKYHIIDFISLYRLTGLKLVYSEIALNILV